LRKMKRITRSNKIPKDRFIQKREGLFKKIREINK
jgi:hypothetical protein